MEVWTIATRAHQRRAARKSEEAAGAFANLEFHRTGIGLLPDPHDADGGSAVHLSHVAGSQRPLRFCSCSAGRRKSCRHLDELTRQLKEYERIHGGVVWGELFARSRWHHLAQILFAGESQGFADARVAQLAGSGSLRFLTADGREVLRYLEHSPARVRFLERTGKTPKSGSFADRAGLLERLSLFLRSPEEQHLNKAGMTTNRQKFEESLWCRLAYHALREYGDEGEFEPAVEEGSGELYLTYRASDDHPILQIVVPRSQVAAVLEFFAETGDKKDGGGVVPRPLPARTLFAIEPSTELDDESARRKIDFVLAYGEEDLHEKPERQLYRYGSLVYLKELELLVDLEPRARGEELETPDRVELAAHRLPLFSLKEGGREEEGALVVEDPMSDLRIFGDYDYVEIVPEETNEDSHSLEVRYGFEGEEVSLRELLRAKRAGLPYLETRSGWIDLNSPALRSLGTLSKRKGLLQQERGRRDDRLRLSSAELLRLQASSSKPLRVEGPEESSGFLKRFLELRPAEPLTIPVGLKSTLRPYQKLGLEWLKFLYENQLAGLLCDDMGLGKTHQAMGLMVVLREQLGVKDPFLVVCPRTVISHWRNKLREYAPALRAVQYHGPQRDLSRALGEGDVILTSYGVLRNDVAKLKPTNWGLVVLDEVQQIKNRATLGHRAARAIKARMKLGLTGTPIENSLVELKALFDLILPGYLGSEEVFREKFEPGPDGEADDWQLAHLRRLTSPFILRRLKTAVLDELPEKIEDVRTCRLSEEQLYLYRQTISTKGIMLMEKLRNDSEPLPYIHIFALLNLLKQICDHPALALNDIDSYRSHESSKWDLFVELLDESLESGQKIVVFTQYLGMISIMEQHLDQLGVEYVTLTGASRHRGEIVDRFNEDEDCRVFLGSLKAGGTGIDLVGGSVVIHYDRWWNAAREDQATDRLYRIGQKRVVQVFKLIAEETLEERIASIIDNKRRLMSTVVQADDPKLNKIFTREELIELLRDVGE